MKESQSTANQNAPDSMPGNLPILKEEPQAQIRQAKTEASTPKLESSMTGVKEEVDDFDAQEPGPDALPEEMLGVTENQPFDSEDSLSQNQVASELRRLNELRTRVTSDSNHHLEGGAVAPGAEESNNPMTTRNNQGAVAPDSEGSRENNETYAPQRSDRFRGRLRSPDPYLFSSTIWIRHGSEASARIHGNPVDCLRDRVAAMEHNLDTLRTRLTQVADLRDAQGIREDHRAIIARLNEVEECATVHTLREFMSKICRLEALFSGEDGGVIFDAIRACNRRIDSQKITMDDFYARIRTQEWYHDVSDQEEDEAMENQSGIENRSLGRRRPRGHAPHRRALRQWTRPMPRPPPPENDALTPQGTDRTPENSPEVLQQAMQRLLAAYNQCTHRVAQTDDRMEQFRSNLRRDALELAMSVQRIEQDLQYQFQATARLKESLHDDVQERVKGLEEKVRFMIDHEAHVNQTIDRNAHSQCASI